MKAKRKLWATRYGWPVGKLQRHESKAAAYRYVEAQVANKLCSPLLPRDLTIYVDERDGRGLQIYERIDLAELAKSGSAEVSR